MNDIERELEAYREFHFDLDNLLMSVTEFEFIENGDHNAAMRNTMHNIIKVFKAYGALR